MHNERQSGIHKTSQIKHFRQFLSLSVHSQKLYIMISDKDIKQQENILDENTIEVSLIHGV